jgi:hypothetical protein
MQFIQERLNNHDTVGYVSTRSDLAAETFRQLYSISGAVADPGACTVHKIETTNTKIEVAAGNAYNENNTPVTGDDLLRRSVETSTVHLSEVESIRVESLQDLTSRGFAEAARPEVAVAIVPTVYTMTLVASKPVFKFHVSFIKGKNAPVESDSSGKTDTLYFRDEDTANTLARALTHAVELCGGGNKSPF